MSYRIRHHLLHWLGKILLFKKHIGKSFTSPLFSPGEYKKLKKINLACSDRIIPGWVNVDIRDIPGIDHIVDARDLSIFPDESFDIVRASHVIEHFHINELEKVFKEWTRILRPGGWLIICVPSFDITLLRYLVNPHSINPLLFSEFGTAIISQIYGFSCTEPENEPYKHKMVYNYKSLSMLMKTYGKLKNIRSINFLLEEPYTLNILDDGTTEYSLNIAGQK